MDKEQAMAEFRERLHRGGAPWAQAPGSPFDLSHTPPPLGTPAVESLEDVVRRGIDLVRELNDIRCGLGNLSDKLLGLCPAMEVTDRPIGGARVPDLMAIMDGVQDQVAAMRETLRRLTSAV